VYKQARALRKVGTAGREQCPKRDTQEADGNALLPLLTFITFLNFGFLNYLPCRVSGRQEHIAPPVKQVHAHPPKKGP